MPPVPSLFVSEVFGHFYPCVCLHTEKKKHLKKSRSSPNEFLFCFAFAGGRHNSDLWFKRGEEIAWGVRAMLANKIRRPLLNIYACSKLLFDRTPNVSHHHHLIGGASTTTTSPQKARLLTKATVFPITTVATPVTIIKNPNVPGQKVRVKGRRKAQLRRTTITTPVTTIRVTTPATQATITTIHRSVKAARAAEIVTTTTTPVTTTITTTTTTITTIHTTTTTPTPVRAPDVRSGREQ